MPVAVREVDNPTKRRLLDVEDILKRMTLPEKVSLLSGKDNWHTRDMPALGIPSLRLSDGPNGCRGTKFFEGVPAACFPCATGLASTWDQGLLQQVGAAIGEECHAKGVHVLLAPTVNTHRTPLNGRGFESFSEDPLLSGRMAAAFIRGCQSTGVATALKHLVCNDQETNRYSISVEVTERALREIYLRPFEIAIRESRPWVVMTSYNRVNGRHTSDTQSLVTGILREEWDWEGLVVSDWHGTYSIDEAIHAGVDLEMPGPSMVRGLALQRMVTCGKVEESEIDDRVRQVLQLVNRVGPSGIPSNADEKENPRPPIKLMRHSASDAIILLKNDANVLPLSAGIRTVAVIGPNALRTEISGGGSAALRPTHTISPLQGIKSAVGSTAEIHYAQGCDAHKLTPLIGDRLSNKHGQPGFDVAFYNERPSCSSSPVHSLTTTHSNMFFNDNLPDTLHKACYARVEGTFIPSRSATYEFGVGALGTADLYLDDKLLIENSLSPIPGELFFGKGSREETAVIDLEEGRSYRIRVEYASPSASTSFVGPLALNSRGGLRFGGHLKLPAETHRREAVALAQSSDAVIVVLGLTAEFETEGFDRKDMKLPPDSLALLEAVLAVRSDAVICIQSGTAVEMPFAAGTATLVHFFYNGNEVGNGLADVLFGQVNPSGKLPYTCPVRLEDYDSHTGSLSVTSTESFPGDRKKVCYHEGVFVGYRQFVSRGPPPAFAFGHGLSYTSFEYSDCHLDRDSVTLSTIVRAQCIVTNTGLRPGREIVQLYVSPPSGQSVDRPARELKGFGKTGIIRPGKSEVISIQLDKTAFAFYQQGWQVKSGLYRLEFAASSGDIRHTVEMAIDRDFSF